MAERFTLPITLGGKVGYHGQKSGTDVDKIHWLLSRIPAAKKGTSHLLGKPYSRDPRTGTDLTILAFQKAHFTDTRFHDATVWPNGDTLKKMNELAGDGSVAPAPSPSPAPVPAPAPAPVAGGAPRHIRAIVVAAPHSHAYVKGYSEGSSVGRFRVPTYKMAIGPETADGSVDPVEGKVFEVITWGVRVNSAAYQANKPFNECFSIAAPRFGEFTLKAFNSNSLGKCWQLVGEYLLHDGPGSPRWLPTDDTGTGLVGALGCIEVCGKQTWTDFMKLVHTWAFGLEAYKGMSYDEADRLLDVHGAFRLNVQPSARPALKPVTDFRPYLPGAPAPAPA